MVWLEARASSQMIMFAIFPAPGRSSFSGSSDALSGVYANARRDKKKLRKYVLPECCVDIHYCRMMFVFILLELRSPHALTQHLRSLEKIEDF